MPFKSQAQERAAFGGYLGPEMKAKAKEWADETDQSSLPRKIGGKMKSKAHPGFKAVQSKIEGEGYSRKIAGKILASRTRNASASAKRHNPRLKKVKG